MQISEMSVSRSPETDDFREEKPKELTSQHHCSRNGKECGIP
jgi:hypothetical protein